MSMLSLFCRVQSGALVPLAEWDREQLERIGEGAEVTARVRRGRSVDHHRWYWAALSTLVSDTPIGNTYPTKENLHEALLLSTGQTTAIWHPVEHCRVLVPCSTSFAAMDQTAFNEYTAEAFKLIAEHFGIDVDEVMQRGKAKVTVA